MRRWGVATSLARRRGAAAVEFGLVVLGLVLFLFAIIEYARLMFLWNAVQDVTRRAARAAAITDFSDSAAMQLLRQKALLRDSDGPLLLAPNVDGANVRIEYLWQDSAGALQAVTPLPGCPLANRVNCARDPLGSSCIRFIRVRLCQAGPGACQPPAYQALLPLVPVPATLPPATALVAAESLGFTPGQAPCP